MNDEQQQQIDELVACARYETSAAFWALENASRHFDYIVHGGTYEMETATYDVLQAPDISKVTRADFYGLPADFSTIYGYLRDRWGETYHHNVEWTEARLEQCEQVRGTIWRASRGLNPSLPENTVARRHLRTWGDMARHTYRCCVNAIELESTHNALTREAAELYIGRAARTYRFRYVSRTPIEYEVHTFPSIENVQQYAKEVSRLSRQTFEHGVSVMKLFGGAKVTGNHDNE